MTHIPGPTLADTKGQRRILKLEDSIFNLQCQILEKLDCIQTMQDEIQKIREI